MTPDDLWEYLRVTLKPDEDQHSACLFHEREGWVFIGFAPKTRTLIFRRAKRSH